MVSGGASSQTQRCAAYNAHHHSPTANRLQPLEMHESPQILNLSIMLLLVHEQPHISQQNVCTVLLEVSSFGRHGEAAGAHIIAHRRLGH